MNRWKCLTGIAIAAAFALPGAAASAAPSKAADCRFDGARSYERFGRIQVFTDDGKLYGCLMDVGRAHRLDTGTMPARSSATRRALFGMGDWIGFAARERSGAARVRAINLRTGARHAGAVKAAVTALVVNHDGTLAWIAGREIRTKSRDGRSRTIGSAPDIDRRFLGIENDQGCAVTWRAGSEQRSSTIYCSRP